MASRFALAFHLRDSEHEKQSNDSAILACEQRPRHRVKKDILLMPGPEPIGEILSRLFTMRGWGRKQGRLQLEQAWAEAAGPEVAEMTRLGGLRRGVLEVEVAHAVLLQELAHFQKRQLLQKLKEKLPDSGIHDLKFRAGAWKTI